MSSLRAWTQGGHSLDFVAADTPVSLWWRQRLGLGQWSVDTNLSQSKSTETRQRISELTGIDPQLLDQHCLNALHRQFERQHRHEGEDPRWREINLLIHQLENQSKGTELFLAVSQLPEQRQPIPTEWRQLWQHQPRRGDLTLGYHTIGKTLTSCYWDQDSQLITQGAVSPQRDLHSQALLTLSTPLDQQPLRATWNLELDRKIQAWAADHGPLQDLTGIEHRYHGRPLLARVVNLDHIEQFCASLHHGDRFDRWEII